MKTSFFIFVLAALNPSMLLSEWKTLESPEYSIAYPDDWSLDQSGLSGTKLILFAPLAQGQAFRNNVNLIVQDLTGMGIGLDKYVEISVGQIKQYIVGAKILHSQAKNSRHEIIYTGKFGEMNLKWKQYSWVEGEKAYVLTFTAPENSFDGELELADRIMDSFKIR